MDDGRVWGSEEGLWTADEGRYRETVDKECVMVLPMPPHVFVGEKAADAVSATPRWSKVALSERQVMRPQEGLIVIAYKVVAEAEGRAPYEAHCTSTYRRIEHDHWTVVQHQQTPPLIAGS